MDLLCLSKVLEKGLINEIIVRYMHWFRAIWTDLVLKLKDSFCYIISSGSVAIL